MSPNADSTQNLDPKNGSRSSKRRPRWLLLALGGFLIAFAFGLYLWAVDKYSQNFEPPPESVSISTDPLPKSRQASKSDGEVEEPRDEVTDAGRVIIDRAQTASRRKQIKKPKIVNYQNEPENLQKVSPGLNAILFAQVVATPTPSTPSRPKASPSPTPAIDKKKDRNVFEKVIDWFMGLFRSKKDKTSSPTAAANCTTCKDQCECPVLSVSGPGNPVESGDDIVFTANIKGGSRKGAKYKWSNDKGNIVDGEFESAVTINTSGLDDTAIKATVRVSGLCDKCNSSASATAIVKRILVDVIGTVVDLSGNPVTDVSVELVFAATGEHVRPPYITKADGKFSFSVPPGKYGLVASLNGVKNEWVPVKSDRGSSQTKLKINVPTPTPPTPTRTPTPPPTPALTPPPKTPIPPTTGPVRNGTPVQAASPGVTPTRPPDSNSNTNVSENTNTGPNTASNSNTGKRTLSQNVVVYSLPRAFLDAKERNVRISLRPRRKDDPKTSSETNKQSNRGGETEGIDSNLVVEKIEGYETLVRAFLLNSGKELNIELKEGSEEQTYDHKSGIKWVWGLKLNPEGAEKEYIDCRAALEVRYKPIDPANEAFGPKEVWPKEFGIYVDLPLWLQWIYWLSGLIGVFASGFGFYGGTVVVEDDVHCTLYSKPEVRQGDDFLVQVFAHLLEQSEGLDELARQDDPAARNRLSKALSEKIARDTKLTFKLVITGIDFEEEETLIWRGDPIPAQFVVSVPADVDPGKKIGKVFVLQEEAEIGRMILHFEVVTSGAATSEKIVASEMIRQESAFVSYTSKDKAKVYEFVKILEEVKYDFHIDILDIDPGERWEQKLYKYIETDPTFILFWSKAASQSEYVMKEVALANEKTGKKRKKPPKIVIHHLEDPAYEVPEWLRDIHVDRKWDAIMGKNRD